MNDNKEKSIAFYIGGLCIGGAERVICNLAEYFYSEGYQERLARGEHQKQLSKEFVREWLMSNGFQGQEGQTVPEMTEEVVNGISDRYIELYENITGERFVKAEGTDISARIEKNITDFLKTL